jgi:hypothetical protein
VSDYIDLDALWRVGALSLLFGVGVVGLYALGLRALVTASGEAAGRGRGWRALGVACLVACGVAIVFGIWVMLDK